MKQYIEVGEFVKLHGIAGELKLYPWCDEPSFVTHLSRVFLDSNGQTQLQLENVRIQKNMCLVKIKGVDTTDKAHSFIGKQVYFLRSDIELPDGRYFAQDVLGCDVIDEKTRKKYGVITSITHPAASDIYEITDSDGKKHLFPAVDEFLGEIDINKKVVCVRPISGMFEDGGKSDDED